MTRGRRAGRQPTRAAGAAHPASARAVGAEARIGTRLSHVTGDDAKGSGTGYGVGATLGWSWVWSVINLKRGFGVQYLHMIAKVESTAGTSFTAGVDAVMPAGELSLGVLF